MTWCNPTQYGTAVAKNMPERWRNHDNCVTLAETPKCSTDDDDEAKYTIHRKRKKVIFLCGRNIKNKTNNCTKDLFKNIYSIGVFHTAFHRGNRCSFCLGCLSTLVRYIFEISILVDIVSTPEGERHSVINQPFWWWCVPSSPWASTLPSVKRS